MMAGVQKPKIPWAISLFLVLYFFVLTVQGQYGGGTGDPNDPYQIATADDLMLLGESPEDCDKHFILTADIDLDPNLPRRKVFDRAVIPWFGGTFDGNNLTISHLTIEGGGYLGLFGRLSWGAEVKDLGVVDVNITSSGDQVGGLVGENRGYVTQCYSTGSVTGENYVGGLVGNNGALGLFWVSEQYFPVSLWSTIYNCYSTAYVTGNTGVGGLLGSNRGDVTQCYSKAVVIGNSSVGGLAGANRGDGTIARCYAICTIRKAFRQWQADESIGGLVGTNFGTPGSWGPWYPIIPASVAVISDCYSIVSGDSQVSGLLVGQNGDSNSKGWFSSISPGRIVNCYAACDSSGTVEASGLIGRNYGIYMVGAVSNRFWDAQACGVADNAEGGTPKTTAEMQMASTFLDADWGGCVDEVIWTIDEGNDYPRLWWEDKPGQPLQARLSELLEGDGTEESPYTIYTLEDINTIARFPCEHDKHFRLGFLSGEGTQENPYLIYTTDELDLLSMCPYEQDAYFRLGFVTGEGTQESPYLIYTVDELNLLGICPYELDKHFKLMADIDLAGITYSKAVIPKFAGMFDGNNLTISNLTVDGYENLGLFGQLETGAEVRDLGIVDVNITGSSCVGGLAGRNNGSITASYSTGSVTGLNMTVFLTIRESHTVGGLVGNNKGLINTSFSTGAVTGKTEVGGLVGWNFEGGTVTNCYSTGTVTGEDYVGGLVGNNEAPLLVRIPEQYFPVSLWSTIYNCYSTAYDVTGNTGVGGLVGWNYEGVTVTNCYSTGTVTGEIAVGGLVGNNEGLINTSFSTGTVTGDGCVGGLVGWNYVGWNYEVGTVTNCYSTGTVTGESAVGGIVGNNEGLINTSFSTGTVRGDGEVGGLVGCNNDRIFTSYSTGAVTGETEVGGLVGKNYMAIITTSYSTGAVTGNDLVGGLVGYDWGGLVTASFWDIETSGLTVSAGGAGLSTAEMMDAEILGLNGLGVDPKWVLDNGRDYPRLVWEGTPGQMIPELVIDWLDGSGTVEDPYQIETANQLLMLHDSSLLWGKHFVMNADIDLDPNLTGQNLFEQAVIPTFWGSFVGNGHVILNLRIEGEERLGLFGKLLEGSVVRDLGLESNSVKSSGYNVGALAGNNRGFVTNCYSTGSVSGKSRVGGLLGINYGVVTACYSIGTVTGDKYVFVGGLLGINHGVVTRCYSSGAVSGGDQVGGLVGRTSRVSSVTQCYSTGSVTGVNYVGGLLGSNNGVVTSCYSISTVTGDKYVGGLVGRKSAGSVFNCYSTGSVRGEDSVGGLIGYNVGNVLNCYSACSVFGSERVGGLVGDNRSGYVTYCFWDTWISGQNWSDGGIGKTTAEMQTASTFLEASWDFVDESENGNKDIWWILEGQDYPRLWWELIEE